MIERNRCYTNSYKIESFFFRVGSDGVVTASATNEVGFLGSGGFPLGIGLYGMSSFYGPARPEEEIVELIRYAVEQLGVTLLDTSNTYGPFTNEVLIRKVNNTCKPTTLQIIIVLRASPTVISM